MTYPAFVLYPSLLALSGFVGCATLWILGRSRYLKQVVDKLNEYHSLKEVEDAEKDMKILELEKEVTELKEQIKLLSRKG